MSNKHLDPQHSPEISESGDVWLAVIDDMKYRRRQGMQKYGTALSPFNGRNSLVDAYQEALDLCVYIKQKLIENEITCSLNPFVDEEKE